MLHVFNQICFYLDEQNTTVPSERISTHQDDNVTISIDSLESTFCKYDINNPPDDVRTLQRSGKLHLQISSDFCFVFTV